MNTDTNTKPDFYIDGGGSVYLFRPLNDEARKHLAENVQDGATWFGGALAVEHRFAGDLADALREDGFTVE
jgi:hypothetical protein